MKYTQIPTDTFEKIQLNAGILCTEFAPETGTVTGMLGATNGGMTFSTNATYIDYGEDIDNCPNNMMELKQLQSVDPTMSGNFLTIDPATAKKLCGAADIDSSDATHIVPRKDLTESDFATIWWVGDYSDVNNDESGAESKSAGYIAIKLINALNTTGFQITSSKDAKGQMAFEFHGHYSIDSQDTVPYEIYIKQGA